MITIIFRILATVLMSGLLYVFGVLAKQDPMLTTGIHVRKRTAKRTNKKGLRRLHRVLAIAPWVTLVGGITTALLDNVLLFCLFLFIPCVFGALYLLMVMKQQK